MDGFDENNGVVVLAATNRPESLDPESQGQGILAPAQSNQNPFIRTKHELFMNGLFHLPGKEKKKTLRAKCGMMPSWTRVRG